MGNRTLVAYATRAGTTVAVAEAIGEVLRESGAGVDVRPVKEVSDLSGYGAVVLGGPVRIGKLMPEILQFARAHRAVLARLPVAYFITCDTLREDNPSRRAKALAYVAPLRYIKEPISIGLFAGAKDVSHLHPVFRRLLAAIGVPGGDWRDWPAIRAWAAKLATALSSLSSVVTPGVGVG